MPSGVYVTVKHDFASVVGALRLAVIAVDMYAGVNQLECSFVNIAVTRVYVYVFRLGVVGVHAADVGQTKSSVGLDLGNHAAERVYVRRKANRGALTADGNKHVALFRDYGRVPEVGYDVAQAFDDVLRVARGAVYCKQFLGAFYCVIYVLLHCSISF